MQSNEGNIDPRSRIISYIKPCKFIAKGCVYHVVRFKDLECRVNPLESVPVLNDLMTIFHNDFPEFLLNRKYVLVLTYYQM